MLWVYLARRGLELKSLVNQRLMSLLEGPSGPFFIVCCLLFFILGRYTITRVKTQEV